MVSFDAMERELARLFAPLQLQHDDEASFAVLQGRRMFGLTPMQQLAKEGLGRPHIYQATLARTPITLAVECSSSRSGGRAHLRLCWSHSGYKVESQLVEAESYGEDALQVAAAAAAEEFWAKVQG